MEPLRDKYHPYHRAVKPLNIIIIGAGIAGLSSGLALSQTGHLVTIFESVSKIAEVGAGIQIAPNASRILGRFGILDEVMEYTTVLERVSIRRYDSDEELSSSPLMPSIGDKYGSPMSVIHRGDLQRILLKAAQKSGCRILTSHAVIAVDSGFLPHVLVRNCQNTMTTWFRGDVVIAADGVKSTVRRQMAVAGGYHDQPIPTGDAAYRLLIPRGKIQHDEKMLEMLGQDVAMRYMGPGGHAMAYPLKGNTLYNMVLLHPAKPSQMIPGRMEDSWIRKGDRKEMMDFYSGWSPTIQKLLHHADDEILEWPLNGYPNLPKWVRGSVALVGDACHPMLPYVAQGAANAIEDAAVLAVSLSFTLDVHLALEIYEAVRKNRAENIAKSASATGRSLHLADGPEQRERDEAIQNASKGSGHPDKWGDQKWQDYMWGVDVMMETTERWNGLVASRARL